MSKVEKTFGLEGINWKLLGFLAVFGLVPVVFIQTGKAMSFGASAALIIAFVAYPWQKRKDRDLKVDEEKRKAISELILAIEEYMTKLKRAVLVNNTLPDVTEDYINTQKALSVVRAYGCVLVVERTISYERSIRTFQKRLISEKELRKSCEPFGQDGNKVKHTPEYSAARDIRSEAYSAMMDARDAFFEALSETLDVEVSGEQLDDTADSEGRST